MGGDTANSFSGDIPPVAVQRPALRDRQGVNGREAKARALAVYE